MAAQTRSFPTCTRTRRTSAGPQASWGAQELKRGLPGSYFTRAVDGSTHSCYRPRGPPGSVIRRTLAPGLMPRIRLIAAYQQLGIREPGAALQ